MIDFKVLGKVKKQENEEKQEEQVEAKKYILKKNK